MRFALLGSSARELKAAGTNLLAGRALRKQMFPLTPQELGADFDLETILRFGSLPLAWRATDRRATLLAYVQTYLREEIRAESIVRNLPGFARFLPVAAPFHGQVINISGIVRAVKKQLDPPTAEERGHLFEGWICMLLRCYAEERSLFDDLYYWAPAQARQLEVDFLLQRGRELLAIEVKTSPRLQPAQLAGLAAIAELPNVVRRILVYGGTRRLRTPAGIEVWPLAQFLAALAHGRLWP